MSSFQDPLRAPPHPTNARRVMLGFAVSVAFITYLDRVCIAAAAPAMQAELGLSVAEMGYVFSIFALAYGIFEIPMGWFGDRYGQKRLLARIVACWSVFTVLTGLVRGYFALLATRFLFGAAEAGAFPTLSRALARWFPQSERGRTSGLMWMGARLGGSLAPPLAALLIARIGWRETFIVFGAVGLVWTALFWRWYRDSPAEHPSVNEAELEYIQAGRPSIDATPLRLPWRRLFRSHNLWALFGMYFCSAYGFFFFVTWLPTYLVQEHGLTLERSGWYSSFPLAAGAVACLVGGSASDWLVRRIGSLKWGRRLIGIAGFALAGLGFAAATQANSGLAAVLWLAFAQAAQDLTLPVAWATCIDVSHKYGGTATGFMNTASSISAMISPVSAAWLASAFGSFHSMFFVASIVYCVGALFWGLIDAEQLVED
jgi:MFS transporter, ACS family, glucarate transporter